MLNRILNQGKIYAQEIITKDAVAVDATCGNGHDTKFLLDHISDGKVYAFDIQKEAIVATENKLKYHDNSHLLTLIHDGHEHVLNYVTEKIDVAMFNLGYLPNANKSITTLGKKTIKAIEHISNQLSVGGRIIITIYHGHPAGKDEKDTVLNFVESLDQHYFNVLKYQFINQKNDPPFLVVVERKK